MASAKKSKEESKKKQKSSKETTSAKLPKKTTPASKSKPENKKLKVSNGNASTHDLLVVPSSSCDSEQKDKQGQEQKNSKIKNQISNSLKSKKSKKRKDEENEDEDEKDEGKISSFPMNRIRRIVKSDGPDLQINKDAVFLINLAAEKFLEQFCEDAYKCSVRDRKKSLGYKHLSSIVCKQKRFDFLSDFVPEKVKADVALAERKSAEMGQGCETLEKH